MGGGVFGHHEDARGVFVEAVDNADAQAFFVVEVVRRGAGGEFVRVVEEAVDEGAGGVARPGVYHEALGFVDNEAVRVFVEDGEGNGFGGEIGWGFGEEGAGDAGAGVDALGGFGGPTVEGKIGDALLDLAAGDAEEFGEGLVETESVEVGGDVEGEGGGVSHGPPRMRGR